MILITPYSMKGQSENETSRSSFKMSIHFLQYTSTILRSFSNLSKFKIGHSEYPSVAIYLSVKTLLRIMGHT